MLRPRTCLLLSAAALLLMAAAHTPVRAQGFYYLEDREVYTPFLADVRAPQISILALGRSDAFPFAVNEGSRQVWDIALGKEITVLGYDRTGESPWRAAFVIPVGFHMIEDFKDDSEPILNTDYRFGFALKYQRGDPGFGRSWGARWVVFGHESTHLGDEFSLAAAAAHPDFIRVNVSYEYTELSFLLQHAGARGTLRGHAGVMVPVWTRNDSFYSFDLRETGGRELTLSESNYEPYAAVEALETQRRFGRFGLIAGAEARPRLLYDYLRAPGTDEEREWSFNVMVGLRDAERRPGERGVADLYARFYHGVNPAGQFRSQAGYTLLGLGLRLDI